ncbi:MAG: T9SS type A sorting domain-containing protein [Brumimicrobium sp.]|nr:T9SS type A sorting domain-containing protein [Brumimicrobium sp.]
MMKNLNYLIPVFIVLSFFQNANAQSCDTLRNYNLNDVFYEFTGVGGYVLGHEKLNGGTSPVTQWAEPYTVASPTEVRRLRFVPWKVHDAGGQVIFTVYQNNTGTPGTVLGTQTVPLSDFTANTYTEVDFTTPVNVSGTFFVGFQLAYNTPQDTFAITGTHKPGGTNYTQMYFDAAWSACNNVYTIGADPFISAWQLDVLTSTAPSPVADFTSNWSACLGGVFNVDGNASTNVDEYFWILGDNPYTQTYDSGTGITTSLSPTISGGNQAIYLVADGGCQTDVVGYVATVYDPINATVSTSNSTCGNNNGSITVSNVTGGSGTYSYSLDGTNYQNSNIFSNLAPGAYTVYVASGGNACETTYSVTVSATPQEAITVGANQTICSGQSATITASGNGTIEWFNGGVSIGTGTSVTVTPGSSTTYDAVLTDANNCQDTDQITVNVNPLPVVDAGANNSICTGDSYMLTASGANAYTWNNGLGAGASHSVSPTTTTTYEVTGTDGNGCSNTDQVTITVNSLPTVSASSNISICANTSTTISATGALTYSWDNGLGAGASHSVSPLTTTTYEVTGTDGNGCSNTDQVTVTVNSLPVVTANSDASICQGDNTVISATGASTYSWDNGLGAGASHTVSPTGSTTYEVTGTDGNGCTDTDQVTITVNALPTVDAGPNVSICNGDNTTISASGASSYSWDNGLGAGASHVVSPSSTTTFEVTGTDANNCQNTDQITVTVNAIDDPSFTFNNFCDLAASNGPTNIATPGGTFSFNPAPTDGATIDPNTGEITGGIAGTTYSVEYTTNGACPDFSTETVTVQSTDDPSFSFDDICLGNGAPIQPYNVATPGGTFSFSTAPADGATINNSTGEISNATQGSTYSVEYLTPSGACQSSATMNVQVYNAPTVVATGTTSICEGQSTVISASGADNFDWDNGLGTGASHTVIPTSTTTYTVIGEDNATGCTNTDNVMITVNPLPSVDAGTNQTICEGDVTVLTATGADTYAWDNGLGTGATQNVSPNSTTTYTVTGEITATGCSNTAQVTVNVNLQPVVDAGTDQEICDGESVTINASGADSYSWDNGLGSGPSHTVSPSTTTTYTVTGTDQNNCSNTDEIIVTVNALPTVDAGDDQTMCVYNASITLNGTPTGGSYSGPGVTNNEFDPAAAGLGTHQITYTYSDINGCENSDVLTITVDQCASLSDNDLKDGITVMPNPATDFIKILVTGNIEIGRIELFSAEGKVIPAQVSNEFSKEFRIDLVDVDKGTYFLKMKTTDGTLVRKVVIH